MCVSCNHALISFILAGMQRLYCPGAPNLYRMIVVQSLHVDLPYIFFDHLPALTV